MEELKIIKDIISNYYDLSTGDILGKSRKRHIMEARRQLCYILRNDLGMKFLDIGKALNMNHSSVIHHNKTLQGYLDNNEPKATNEYNTIIGILNRDTVAIDLVKNIKSIDSQIEKLKKIRNDKVDLLSKKQKV
tara:strand:+ start:3981 stop:4382 length:402 start_codon:yes stop_codon:yes gene_type:complete